MKDKTTWTSIALSSPSRKRKQRWAKSTPPSPRNPKPLAGQPWPHQRGEMPSRTQGPHYGRPIPPTGRNARPDAAPAHVGPSLHVRGCRTRGCLARSPLSSLLAHRKRNATQPEGEGGKAGADCPHHPQERRGAGGQEEDAGGGGLKGQGAITCFPVFPFPSCTTVLRCALSFTRSSKREEE
jgi:hypothetical protein